MTPFPLANPAALMTTPPLRWRTYSSAADASVNDIDSIDTARRSFLKLSVIASGAGFTLGAWLPGNSSVPSAPSPALS